MFLRIKNNIKTRVEGFHYLIKKRNDDRPFKPVFIIGCGRSGTSILGTTLSMHPKIYYLKETISLSIFSRLFPETDIYFQPPTPVSKTQLIFDTLPASNNRSKLLRRAFQVQFLTQSKPVFVEKLYMNVFRLHWLFKTFPEARFIYIHRNGLEVAASIKERGQGWFGRNDIKWRLLAEYATNTNHLKPILPLVQSNFEKGLLEWRIATELATSFFEKLPKEKFHTIKYAHFMDDPVLETTKILDFLDVEESEEIISFAKNNIKRKTAIVKFEDFDDAEKLKRIYGEVS